MNDRMGLTLRKLRKTFNGPTGTFVAVDSVLPPFHLIIVCFCADLCVWLFALTAGSQSVRRPDLRPARYASLGFPSCTVLAAADPFRSFSGHNGAGKSTTINMMTGMLPISGGQAKIWGNDVSTEIE